MIWPFKEKEKLEPIIDVNGKVTRAAVTDDEAKLAVSVMQAEVQRDYWAKERERMEKRRAEDEAEDAKFQDEQKGKPRSRIKFTSVDGEVFYTKYIDLYIEKEWWPLLGPITMRWSSFDRAHEFSSEYSKGNNAISNGDRYYPIHEIKSIEVVTDEFAV